MDAEQCVTDIMSSILHGSLHEARDYLHDLRQHVSDGGNAPVVTDADYARIQEETGIQLGGTMLKQSVVRRFLETRASDLALAVMQPNPRDMQMDVEAAITGLKVLEEMSGGYYYPTHAVPYGWRD